VAQAEANESSFSVLFSCDAPVQQQTYLLDHGTLGRFSVFLVPGAGAGGQPTCTASFNYLTSALQTPVALPVRTLVTLEPLQTLTQG
jgi:hypothetical protein